MYRLISIVINCHFFILLYKYHLVFYVFMAFLQSVFNAMFIGYTLKCLK